MFELCGTCDSYPRYKVSTSMEVENRVIHRALS